MSVEQQQGRADKGMRSGFVLAALVGLPLLYVASVGPANWLLSRGHIHGSAEDFLQAFYAPLQWISDHSEIAKRGLYWWADLGT
jgi:hypothetical protein